LQQIRQLSKGVCAGIGVCGIIKAKIF
jgi:hypothetical protein